MLCGDSVNLVVAKHMLQWVPVMQGTVRPVWRAAPAQLFNTKAQCLVTLKHRACWGPSRASNPSSFEEQTVHVQLCVAKWGLSSFLHTLTNLTNVPTSFTTLANLPAHLTYHKPWLTNPG